MTQVGYIHLIIAGDTILKSQTGKIFLDFQAYIDTFPKADFEEIVYDKKNNEVYLSIEGNGLHPQYYAGIYQLNFRGGNVLSDTLESIDRIDFHACSRFSEIPCK